MWLVEDCPVLSGIYNAIPYYMCFLLSLLIFLSPIDPTRAAQDFTAYRLAQYDIQGSITGSRTAALSCDIQIVSTRTYARRCPIVKLAEITVEGIKNAIFNNAGGIIVLLPSDNWTDELRSHWHYLETELKSEEFQIPVYFAIENEYSKSIYDDLQNMSHDLDQSAGSGIWDAIFSTGYRVYINTPPSVPLKNAELVSIEGKILSNSFDIKKPTVLVTAYYDAGGVIPALAYGADANAGGVAVLLEVARIIGQLTDAKNSPKYNIIFLLTSGGKFNFLGSRRWLEMNLEDTAGLAILDSVVQVICLEGLGANFDDHLRLHVSRMPRDGSFSQKLVSTLELAAKLHPLSDSYLKRPLDNETQIEVVHKKINVNQYDLAWEHERFSLYRLPTATFSAWPTPSIYKYRQSVLDGGPLSGRAAPSRGYWGPVKPEILARNTRVLAETLARLLFDFAPDSPSAEAFSIIDPSWVTATSSAAILDFLTMHPRSLQLLAASTQTSSTAASSNGLDLIRSLEQHMRSILPEVKLLRHPLSRPAAASAAGARAGSDSVDKAGTDAGEDVTISTSSQVPSMAAAAKEVEITLYSGVAPQVVTVYRLKSSIFDLVIACSIGAYLYCLYFCLERFHLLVRLVAHLTNNSGKKLKAY
ncbi:unnamed protein product [Schistocephalus solidus]|uniref:BOS complex subunit NCLN n=1 Tax=Schistocephalus solidus TaxID=70667 RepID=A0A0V0J7L6_SCHSO|nr:unnamed protein product [Schistocephalus solidus]